MTITLGVNFITRQMTSFFSSTHELYALVYFLSAFQNLQNSIPWGPPLHYFPVCKIHIYISKMTRSSLWTLMYFSYVKFVNFCYITCFVPILLPTCRRSHGLKAVNYFNPFYIWKSFQKCCKKINSWLRF